MQRSGGDDENEIIFVIEACQKSGQAEYHTRINEAKYIEYFNKGKCHLSESSRYCGRGEVCNLYGGRKVSFHLLTYVTHYSIERDC